MTKRKCVHHYIIESPRGRKENRGVCKLCGRVKLFPATLEKEGGAWGVPRSRRENTSAA